MEDSYEEYIDPLAPHHTQFLDLTNGEGGERFNTDDEPVMADPMDDVDDDDDDEPEEDEARPMAQVDGSQQQPTTTATTALSSSSRKSGGAVNPNTPGRVVDPGHEQTGRWTKEEHEAFLAALRMYGKEWKKVAAKVKTRTVVQTRTHAQKYFQKLQKVQDSGQGEMDHVDMGISGGSPDGSSTVASSGSAKKPHGHKKKRATPITAMKEPHLSRRGSNATISAAQVMTNLSHLDAAPQISLGEAPPAHGFAPAGSSNTMMQQQNPPRAHGFSTDPPDLVSFTAGSSGAWGSVGAIKIVAPDPMAAAQKGKFPEPSPAATGKRKLAEIAAARMLAGVAGVATEDQDGPPTPPPPDDPGVRSRFRFKEAPPPPPLFHGDVADVDAAPGGRRKGLTLQIVNPASLGVSNEKRRRGADGENSPVTPWDMQLKALVSEQQTDSVPPIDSFGADSPVAPLFPDMTKTNSQVSSELHPVCGPASDLGRSALHRAVCNMDIEALHAQLSEVAKQGTTTSLSQLDEGGYAPLHSAAALSLIDPKYAVAASEIVRALLAAGADINIRDRHGNTPLHWAARAGDCEVAEKLLVKNCLLGAKNDHSETPLHWGMRAGLRGCDMVSFLLQNGAQPGSLNGNNRRPADVAADGFADEPGSVAALKERDGFYQGKKLGKDLKKMIKLKNTEVKDTRANLLARSTQSRTLLLHHPECYEHVPKSSYDWEAPDRVSSILKRLTPPIDSSEEATDTRAVLPHEISMSSEFERAKLDLLKRVHSTDYLSFVHNLSKDLESRLKEAGAKRTGENDEDDSGMPASVLPFTPMVQRTMIKIDESDVKQNALSDTAFSAGSLKASRRAAGAVQHAVDCVLIGRNRNAFCVVRPPGHHAGVNGLLDGGESCGFCIFNNVAAGALYAIAEDRLLCERCAIVDIDVHHGNGTEEIVRKCHDPSKLFFFSIHLYDNEQKKRGANQFHYKFYPGTGSEDDLALNIINVPIVPLWREQSPTPPPPKQHNTRRKARSNESQEDESPIGTPKGSARSSDAGSETGSVQATSSNSGSGLSGRVAYRRAIQSRLLPALRAFNPDLILISAGFDAAKGDVGNARHERGGRERLGLDLEPEDYAWTTRKILEIADICCQGRVVSVLEGGYGRTPQQPPDGQSGDKIVTLDRTIFAESAVRHLHAMIDPYDVEHRFTPIR